MFPDLDSSSIVFPPASNEPKLAALPTTKVPDYADWASYSFYNMSLEKSSLPMHMLTDAYHLAPEGNEPSPRKVDTSSTLSDSHGDRQRDLRLILKGALDAVEKDMDETMHGHSANYNWSWKDEMAEMTSWDSGYESDPNDPMSLQCDLSSASTAGGGGEESEVSSTATVGGNAPNPTKSTRTKPFQMAVHKLKNATSFHKTKRISPTSLVRQFQRLWNRRAD